MTNVDSGGRAAAEPNTILRATVGSKLHGLNLEATDDTDEMGVCVEPPEFVVGLRQFEQWVYRTQPEGHPSGPRDLDLTIYSLRKWVRLAVVVIGGGARLHELQELAPSFISRAVAAPFLGYLSAQRQRLTGERGGRARRKGLAWERPGAGYDTKYAMHMVRLGFQGVELLETGRITLPMPAAQQGFTMAIRRGEVDLNEVLTRAGELEQRISDLKDTSPLPERPESELIQEWMVRTYLGPLGEQDVNESAGFRETSSIRPRVWWRRHRARSCVAGTAVGAAGPRAEEFTT